jgi:hypothetical protein
VLQRALLWLPRAIYRVLRGFFLGIANWIAEMPKWIASLFPDPSLEKPEQLEPGKDLGKRIDRVQRAFDAELTRSSSLNMRGTGLAVGSALAILLLAQFSSVWLDDNTWSFSDAADKAERILLYLSLLFLVICLVFAAVVITPRRRVGGDLKRLLRAMNEGRAQDEAATLLQATEIQRAWNEKRGRHLRVVTIPLAIAIAAGVGQAVVFAHWANPVDHSTCVNHDGNAEATTRDGLPPPDDQQTLAERYAPRVYFYPGEPWGPITPSRFIQGSKLVWNSPRADEVVEPEHEIDENRLGADCEQASSGCYEHNGCDADQVTRPSEQDNRASGLISTRGFAIDPNEMVKQAPVTADNPDVPVYYEFRLGNQSRLRLTYWFFETNSLPHLVVGPARSRVAAHEGDWESIDVVLDKDSHDPQRVLFYAHGKDPLSREWPQACVVDESAPPRDPRAENCNHGPESGHPVVYSAFLDHASYPEPRRGWPCGFDCSDLTARGPVWDTWTTGVLGVVDRPWWGFGGAWGAGGGTKGEIGPLGPSPWKQSSDPDPDLSELETAAESIGQPNAG